MSSTTLNPLSPGTADGEAFRLYRPRAPAAALGLAVAHLMGKPAFARQPFGVWCRVLVGQVNRGHYHLVLDPEGRVAGFLGWALVEEGAAEAWLRGRDIDGAAATDGDCIVFNAWSADNAVVQRLLVDAARAAAHGRRRLYAQRFHPDGSTRPIAIPVGRHGAGRVDGAPQGGASARGPGPAIVETGSVPGPFSR